MAFVTPVVELWLKREIACTNLDISVVFIEDSTITEITCKYLLQDRMYMMKFNMISIHLNIQQLFHAKQTSPLLGLLAAMSVLAFRVGHTFFASQNIKTSLFEKNH